MPDSPRPVIINDVEKLPRTTLRNQVEKVVSNATGLKLIANPYIDSQSLRSLPGFVVEIPDEPQDTGRDYTRVRVHTPEVVVLIFAQAQNLSEALDKLDQFDLAITQTLSTRPCDFLHEWHRVGTQTQKEQEAGLPPIAVICLKYEGMYLTDTRDTPPEKLSALQLKVRHHVLSYTDTIEIPEDT